MSDACDDTDVKIGDLIVVTDGSTTYSICLSITETGGIQLNPSADTVDKYIISIDGDGNIFGNEDNKFAIINIDKQNIYISNDDGM